MKQDKQKNGVNQFEPGQKINVKVEKHEPIGWEKFVAPDTWERICAFLTTGKLYTVNMACGPNNDHVSLEEDSTYPECFEFHPNHFTGIYH